jgi:hypothetical protein
MELVEQRIKLPSAISEQVYHLSEGWQTHGINDVLPLGSMSNVHGIMSNGHHTRCHALPPRPSIGQEGNTRLGQSMNPPT